MNIVHVKKTRNRNAVLLVRMDRDEALKTIESLAAQIRENNCNSSRWEKFADDGTDFSISVQSASGHKR